MTAATNDLPDFNASTKSLLMLGEDLTITGATDAFLAAWSLLRDDIAGRSVFEVFPNATDKDVRDESSHSRLLPIQELFDRAPGGICVTRGPTHIFEIVNQPFYKVVCHRQIIGIPVREAFPHAAGHPLIQLLDKVYATGQPYAGQAHKLRLQPSPGAPLVEAYIDFIFQPIFAADGSVAGILAFGHNVTNEVHARNALHASEERFHLALEAAGDGVWDWDIPANRFVFSARGRAMLGYDENEIGNRLENWLAITHPEDQERIRANTMACLQGRIPFISAEYRVRCKDGSWKWLLSRGAVVSRDEKGWATRMVGTTIDISTEQETLRRANFDSLTSLPNRNLFRDRLDKEVQSAKRSGKPVALLFIDLDRFKEVNDLLGHDAGDKLLRECANRIRSCVRAADTVARLGGDEFTVILIDLESRAHVEDIAQKILDALARPFELGQERVHVSGSIGITVYPDDGEDPEHLVRNADQAMYVSKNAGRNQFHFFTRSMQEQAWHRITMMGELRNALPRNELQLYFQPVVELARGRIMKGEALLRWHHPYKGMLPPSEFIGLAEESGLINEIGNWVFMQATAWSKRWTELTGSLFQVSVNASPLQFMQRKGGLNWGRHLSEFGLAWNSISVEITEGLLFNTSSATAEQLLSMRDAGIQVAIDDFGTGYSSMAYLKKFDVDYLKIDQSFIRGTAPNSTSRTIAETIIVMAHKLGLKVIAEGVETPEQCDWLQHAGCDFGQGFLFSRPVPPDQFERLLVSRSSIPA
ncbi:putative bifunctional diguanylate cyclase/phosphodiesterase [Noviherbaspirillum sp. ST9]|uniref:putative bifunctional diguanylate cyclase/phosphodiesterase n=1 Tax=Noviherbaspirillum sp. ST9 TaxID=3401606 RepID=UPI003B58A676